MTRSRSPETVDAIRLASKLALLGVLLIAFGGATAWAGRAPDASYLAAVVDKSDALDRTARSGGGRILLVGGSNLAFGVNSAAIALAAARPVVNLGLHAGIGLKHAIAEAEGAVRPGDVVVISPEYEQFFGDHWLGDETLVQTLSYRRDLGLRIARFDRRPQPVVLAVVSRFRRNFCRARRRAGIGRPPSSCEWTGEIYARRSFNEYGDVVAHLDRATGRAPRPDTAARLGAPNDAVEWALATFTARAEMRGAKVVVAFPPYPATRFAANRMALEPMELRLRARLGSHVLGTMADFVFDDQLFFDTHYHLGREGRDLRTARLLALVQRHGLLPH